MGEFESRNSDSATEHKVRFLSQPTNYADRPQTVEAIETHMSWVFLTDHFAYKLKKPVRYEFLDFSTVEARLRDCEAELRLNRRLAPDVYLDIVPLALDEHDSLTLTDTGRTVDWLVKMRRLPWQCMLDWGIQHQTVQKEEVRDIARFLARFYQQLPPVALSTSAYRDRLRQDVNATSNVLLDPAYDLPEDRVRAIAAGQLAFLDGQSEQLDRRVQLGRIIEGHGDLRPEHICLKPQPTIIDCLEFKREFRILDPVDELAFLALECERLGAAWIGPLVMDTYSSTTGDRPPILLVEFYKSYRAYLRAKIAIWHTREPGKGDTKTWFDLAVRYLDLAEQHLPLPEASDRVS
ncbi:MAG: hypothetical protein AB4040_14840 [Synechococcus sp.]